MRINEIKTKEIKGAWNRSFITLQGGGRGTVVLAEKREGKNLEDACFGGISSFILLNNLIGRGE